MIGGEDHGDMFFGSFFFFPPIDVMNTAIFNCIRQRHLLPNFKLGTIAKHLGMDMVGDLHDAMVDIRLTADIFFKFLEDIPEHMSPWSVGMVSDETIQLMKKSIEQSQKLLGEYILPDSNQHANDVITKLLGILDSQKLVRAMKGID